MERGSPWPLFWFDAFEDLVLYRQLLRLLMRMCVCTLVQVSVERSDRNCLFENPTYLGTCMGSLPILDTLNLLFWCSIAILSRSQLNLIDM